MDSKWRLTCDFAPISRVELVKYLSDWELFRSEVVEKIKYMFYVQFTFSTKLVIFEINNCYFMRSIFYLYGEHKLVFRTHREIPKFLLLDNN
jgi:hypothetical protein